MNDQLDSTGHSLITRERTSKLELLIHLLVNLSQPLLVCGPEGIGKTTLLKALQSYKAGIWQYCFIQGHADLSFEDVIKQLSQALQPGKAEFNVAFLAALYEQYQKQNKKIVLMIDDAGTLVPGLLTAITRYVEVNPIMNVVFSLTHDQLFVMSRSDRVIENCHLIEIPPLSEQQCGDYLQYLATKSGTQISLPTITDSMIEHVYRETRGLPGKILAALPVLSRPQTKISYKWLALLVLAALTALAGQWLKTTGYNIDKIWLVIEPLIQQAKHSLSQESAAPPPPVTTEVVPMVDEPQPEQDAVGLDENPEAIAAMPAESLPNNIEPVQQEPGQALNDAEFADDVAVPAQANGQDHASAADAKQEQQPVAETEPTQSVPPVPAAAGHNENADADSLSWLSAQPTGNVTLQLMVLATQELVTELQNKHKNLGQEIRYVKRVKYGKTRYIVFCGSFANAELATTQRNTLPEEFKQAMPRNIASIISELK
ncbi:MAG: AAA family ATPase [Methylococcales bacterium]